MKLKKLNEGIKILDVENIDKEEESIKKAAKKELSPIIDATKAIIKSTAKGEKLIDPVVEQPEQNGKTKLVDESVLTEAPKLEPDWQDGRKSFYGKARWDTDSDGTKYLISYSTRVAEITPDNEVNLLPYWNYSQTTLRHVKTFLRDNGFRADSMKQMQRDYIDGGRDVILGEDTIVVDSEQPIVEPTENFGISSLLNSLIRDEWEAIDGYKSSIATLQEIGNNESIINILNDIMTEEMIHVGQLEKALSLFNPTVSANAIDDGQAEAEAEINGKIALDEPEI